MTGKHKPHLDTRPLSEKLEEHVEPTVQTVDISKGTYKYKIRGTGHDIDAMIQSLKKTMKRIEDEQLDPADEYVVAIQRSEVTT